MPSTEHSSDLADVDRQYLPRLTVTNADEYLQRSAQRSARARKKLRCTLDIAYGDSPRQKLDLFPGRTRNAPVHVFIHGGYWRALDKHFYSHVAGPMVAAGATVVIPTYDLCPAVRISDIVRQIRRAVAWVYRHVGKNLYLSGHSAGGHLTGMLLATDWRAEAKLPNGFIKAAAPLSGLFDIEPHRHTQLQPDLRLTSREARLMSPMHLAPIATGPVLLAVGALEPHLFHWQSLAYAAHLRRHGVAASYTATTGDNHFAITDRLANPRDPLTRSLIAQMGL